jgi:hypothetical protein
VKTKIEHKNQKTKSTKKIDSEIFYVVVLDRRRYRGTVVGPPLVSSDIVASM